MVALRKYFYHTAREWWNPPRFGLVCLALLAFAGIAGAQNLKNRGTFINRGTFNAGFQPQGLPDTVTGTFGFVGANQVLPRRTYFSVSFEGSGTKTVDSSITILNNVSIAPAVSLHINANEVVTMGGRLTELGTLFGAVKKTENLPGSADSTDFGGIGVSVRATGSALGAVTALRNSGSPINVAGNQSIARFYQINNIPASSKPATDFEYALSELNGNTAATLELWRSTDNGITWRKNKSGLNTGLRKVTKQSIFSNGTWTLADASRPLGSSAIEGSAVAALKLRGDEQSKSAQTQLDSTFVVKIADGFNQAIPGELVTFTVDSFPGSATGQTLTKFSDISDANGEVNTLFTLGNKTGVYRIVAKSPSITDSVVFRAIARNRASQILAQSGNGQADTVKHFLPLDLVAQALDSTVGVDGIAIKFRIAVKPAGDTSAALTNLVDITDVNGRARTQFKLGTKAGYYKVEAFSDEIAGVVDSFWVRAFNGRAARMDSSGTGQQDTVGKQLQPFIVHVTDDEANAVKNVMVHFAVDSVPSGSTLFALAADSALTDSNGVAATVLTLGNKIGFYRVRATSTEPGLQNVTQSFAANARAAAAARMVKFAGDMQRDTINSPLATPLTIRLTDTFGNVKAGEAIQFSMLDTVSGATGFSLSKGVDTTNATGDASTFFTLGNKVGVYHIRAHSVALGFDSVFSLIAKSGVTSTLAIYSGVGQTNYIGDTLTPFIFRLGDRANNLVTGDTVHFSIITRPHNSFGESINVTSAVSDSNGTASTRLVLGSRNGFYTVRASFGSLTDTITAEAKTVVADANHDYTQNVGDLTAVIDHIIGRRILTGYDFIKADVNNDSVVNLVDAAMIRDSILAGTWDPIHDFRLDVSGALPAGPIAQKAEVAPQIPLQPMISPAGVIPGLISRFVITNQYARLALYNTMPVRGLQALVYLKTPRQIDTVDLVFPRAQKMSIGVSTTNGGKRVQLLMYNFANTPLDPSSDTSAIFRLPLKLQDTTDIDSIYVLVSLDSNTVSLVPASPEKPSTIVPTTWALYQNYPNPFNAGTYIRYDVPEVPGALPRVAIQIFNILGQKVRTIEKDVRDFGTNTVYWDGRDETGSIAATGVYFYRLLSINTNFSTTKKMIMLK